MPNPHQPKEQVLREEFRRIFADLNKNFPQTFEILETFIGEAISTTRREVLESVIELVGDEKEKAEFGSTNHEVYIQVGINEERKRLKTTLSSLQSLKDK